jgi:hypothetical protein
MNKPKSLRDYLTTCLPCLQANPDGLQIYIASGNVAATGTGTLSFETAYTLELLFTDYAQDPDTLLIPILAWLRTHQPEMLESTKLMNEGFRFEADYITHDTLDLSVKLALTERVGVTETAGHVTVTHFDEPALVGDDGIDWQQLIMQGIGT